MLPIVLFPLTGVVGSGEVFSAYSNNIIFLFMGGFFLAGALEKWGLHLRLAIGIISVLGTSAPRLILGFMIATSVLSFFVTNTAATMMMLPWRWPSSRASRRSRPDRRAFRRRPTVREGL
jgi:sodium-dependent dicarboxylate transporter 2/3/5